MIDRAGGVRDRLLELVDEDAEAFAPLARAYGIPKDDPNRETVLEEATKGACVAPMEMMRQICRSIDLLEDMGQKGSKMLVSDVGCGALLARAALESASLNVFVNTKSLKDRNHALMLEAECDAMLASYGPKAEAVAADVMARVRG
jgi:formiminotetrahydrofolate cyclodeaminase